MTKRVKFQRKGLQVAISAALVAGITATSVATAGPEVSGKTTYALEALNGTGPTVGLKVVQDHDWIWTTNRADNAPIEVVLHAPDGWEFAPIDLANPNTIPTLKLLKGAGLNPANNADCNLYSGGGLGNGDPTEARFECGLNGVDIDGSVSTANPDRLRLMRGFQLNQVVGNFCDPSATLKMSIEILDDTGIGNGDPEWLENTEGGAMFDPFAMTGPASALNVQGEALAGSNDRGNTTTSIFTTPPFAGFVPQFDTPLFGFSPVDDRDSPVDARANFELVRSLGPVRLDGTTPYVIGAADMVTLVLSDAMQQYAGAESICSGNPASCAGGPDEFNPADPAVDDDTATLGPVPGDSAFLYGTGMAGPQYVQYNAAGDSSMGVQRQIGMSGVVVGELGCAVPHEGNPTWWMWGSYGMVLEAHDVEKPKTIGGVPQEKHTVQLTNNCKGDPIPYVLYAGDGKPDVNALSCGALVPHPSLDCDGFIPPAVGGQPGNRTISVGKITRAADNREVTVRAYIGTSKASCVHGSYDELDLVTGARRTTVMERDFATFLEDGIILGR